MNKIFVYGSLTNQSFTNTLLGSQKEYTDAILLGYAKTEKKGLPNIVKADDQVEGFVFEVDDTELKKLDEYEALHDGLYERVVVEVQDIENMEEIAVQVYQMPPGAQI
jgi:gamma-glutamylcyclotransferase (GGCT)/AIG2-like uncharacterized protein YtfP